jgi:hypothetical protein
MHDPGEVTKRTVDWPRAVLASVVATVVISVFEIPYGYSERLHGRIDQMLETT